MRAEPGSEAVDGVLGLALITCVNWAEVLQKSLSAGVEVEGMRLELRALGLAVEPTRSLRAGSAENPRRLRRQGAKTNSQKPTARVKQQPVLRD